MPVANRLQTRPRYDIDLPLQGRQPKPSSGLVRAKAVVNGFRNTPSTM